MTKHDITLAYDATGRLRGISGSFKAGQCRDYFKKVKAELETI